MNERPPNCQTPFIPRGLCTTTASIFASPTPTPSRSRGKPYYIGALRVPDSAATLWEFLAVRHRRAAPPRESRLSTLHPRTETASILPAITLLLTLTATNDNFRIHVSHPPRLFLFIALIPNSPHAAVSIISCSIFSPCASRSPQQQTKIIALHSKRIRLVSSSVNARGPRPPLVYWPTTQAFNYPEREEFAKSEYGKREEVTYAVQLECGKRKEFTDTIQIPD
ncbi:hypothetical protein B0H13DRAFT_2358409 [Mycena leptocephala]|nr:hypothetical protein B0H13DRAFT_2358409 [Mycena leptocephala]